jgi:hypothetical protein
VGELINYEKLRVSNREIDSKTGRIILPSEEGQAAATSGPIHPGEPSPMIRVRPRVLPVASSEPMAIASSPGHGSFPVQPAQGSGLSSVGLYAAVGMALLSLGGLGLLYTQQLRSQNEVKSQLLVIMNELNANGLKSTQERGRLLGRLEALERELTAVRKGEGELAALRELVTRQQTDLNSARERIEQVQSNLESSVVEIVDDRGGTAAAVPTNGALPSQPARIP